MLFFLVVTRHLPIRLNVDPDFIRQNAFPVRLTYAFFSIQAARPKFYFAWTLGELRPRAHACVCAFKKRNLGCYTDGRFCCVSASSIS